MGVDTKCSQHCANNRWWGGGGGKRSRLQCNTVPKLNVLVQYQTGSGKLIKFFVSVSGETQIGNIRCSAALAEKLVKLLSVSCDTC